MNENKDVTDRPTIWKYLKTLPKRHFQFFVSRRKCFCLEPEVILFIIQNFQTSTEVSVMFHLKHQLCLKCCYLEFCGRYKNWVNCWHLKQVKGMSRYFTDFLSIYVFLPCASRQQTHGNDPGIMEIMETRGFWFLCICIVHQESPRSFKVLNEAGKPPRRTSRKSCKSPDGDF